MGGRTLNVNAGGFDDDFGAHGVRLYRITSK